MRRFNLPLILDTFFAGICAFLLFFTALRYYTKNVIIALVFGIAACLLFGAMGFLYISKKQNKSLLLSRDEKAKKQLSLHLSLSSDQYVKNLFKQCFESAKIRGKRLICGEQSYFFNFKMQPLSEDDAAAVIKYKTNGEKVIFCVKSSPEAAALCENFAIKLIGIDEVYPLLKQKNLLPEKYVYEGPEKISFFKKIKLRFTRRLCAPLFWSGLSLLALSYFTFFPIYYIISGGIMLILAAVVLVIN